MGRAPSGFPETYKIDTIIVNKLTSVMQPSGLFYSYLSVLSKSETFILMVTGIVVQVGHG